MATWQGI